MWNVWEVVDLRTTNIAEAYHNRLNISFGMGHRMRVLKEKLRYTVFKAKCTLRWINEHPGKGKHMKKRDRDRREKIAESMARFRATCHHRGLTTRETEDHCRYMSRNVSGKTI